MLAKVSVKGADITRLYCHLTGQTERDIQWRFTKILGEGKGKVMRRFGPNVDPEPTELQRLSEQATRMKQ